jgi:hypothetical protein
MEERLFDLVVVLHFLWAAFMVGGFVLAVAGIFVPRLRGWIKTRTIHVLGIAFTASVPLWSKYCPVTDLENALRTGAGQAPIPRSFLAHYAEKILYLNVPLWTITAATTLVAVISIVLYFIYPPWKYRRTSTPARTLQKSP